MEPDFSVPCKRSPRPRQIQKSAVFAPLTFWLYEECRFDRRDLPDGVADHLTSHFDLGYEANLV